MEVNESVVGQLCELAHFSVGVKLLGQMENGEVAPGDVQQQQPSGGLSGTMAIAATELA